MHTAKIIAATQPIMTQIDPFFETGKQTEMSAEDFIAYCARVSNPSNQMNTATSDKLLRYCMRNKHWSIFEMVQVVMQIDTTRDIARQILRHRSFSFQEFSQRYADPTKDLGFVTREARLQDTKNRQNSIEVDDPELDSVWKSMQNSVRSSAENAYVWAIENGIAKEQARAVLPEGLTSSRLYMAGSVRSWIHYCQLRCEEGTQKEHRAVALSALTELINYFPFLAEGFDNG
jgi:thymidylate synthase (FAD)